MEVNRNDSMDTHVLDSCTVNRKDRTTCIRKIYAGHRNSLLSVQDLLRLKWFETPIIAKVSDNCANIHLTELNDKSLLP